jgi:hypothetical protein
MFCSFPSVILTNCDECCLDIYEGRCIWLRGPFGSGIHDMTVFWGGKEEDKKENWDQKALYFQIKQGD